MRRGCRADGGVTVVEAAFALPILLVFIFGLVDLGMWTLNANQATNAARDGARRAILDYAEADVDGSPTQAEVLAAAGDHLEGDKIQSIDVRCVDDTGSTIDCSDARVDVDSVKVDVEWTWDLITPVAALVGYDHGAATGSATMRIVGRPLPGSTPTSTTTTSTTTTTTTTPTPSTSVPPEPCAVSSVSAPTSVNRKRMNGNSSSQLATAVPVEFRTNGSSLCMDLRVRLRSSSGQHVEIACGCDLEPPEPPRFRWSYDGSDNIWRPGTAVIEVRNGTTVLATRNFVVN